MPFSNCQIAINGHGRIFAFGWRNDDSEETESRISRGVLSHIDDLKFTPGENLTGTEVGCDADHFDVIAEFCAPPQVTLFSRVKLEVRTREGQKFTTGGNLSFFAILRPRQTGVELADSRINWKHSLIVGRRSGKFGPANKNVLTFADFHIPSSKPNNKERETENAQLLFTVVAPST